MNRASSVDVCYPESDGKPMAESDLHRDWMVRIIELLKLFFAGQCRKRGTVADGYGTGCSG